MVFHESRDFGQDVLAPVAVQRAETASVQKSSVGLQVLARQFFMKHKLVNFHREIENAQAATTAQGGWCAEFASDKYRSTL